MKRLDGCDDVKDLLDWRLSMHLERQVERQIGHDWRQVRIRRLVAEVSRGNGENCPKAMEVE